MEIKQMIIPEGWECTVKNGVATFREKRQAPPRRRIDINRKFN